MGLVSEKGAGRFVGRTDEAAVEVMDQHGQRVALEQQTEVLFLLLEIGNVDADANRAASFDLALLDHDAAAVGKPLFVAASGLPQLLDAMGQPLLLAPYRFRIVPALDADAQGVGQ